MRCRPPHSLHPGREVVVFHQGDLTEAAGFEEEIALHELSLIAPWAARQTGAEIDHRFRHSKSRARFREGNPEAAEHITVRKRVGGEPGCFERKPRITVEKDDDLAGSSGRSSVQLPGAHRSSGDDSRTGIGSNLGSSVSAAAIADDHLASARCEGGRHRTGDSCLFIERRDDDSDASVHSAAMVTHIPGVPADGAVQPAFLTDLRRETTSHDKGL